jgi:sigma-70-like protein
MTTALVRSSTDLAGQTPYLMLAGPVGSLDSYIERVSRIPVLTREEELDLARRLRNDEDLDAARQLVLSHLRFVVHIARGYTARISECSHQSIRAGLGSVRPLSWSSRAVAEFVPAVAVAARIRPARNPPPADARSRARFPPRNSVSDRDRTLSR